jgi:GT2 family glycosyltransferase
VTTTRANAAQLHAVADESSAGVTVIIPTYNREPISVHAVEDLLRQDYAPLEVLIVDQSADPVLLPALAAEHPDVITYCRPTFRGITFARNFGWQHARHGTLIYIDDDVRCPADFVRRHVDALSDSGTSIVAGGVDEPARADEYVDRVGYFHVPTARTSGGWNSTAPQFVDHALGANFSIKRSVFDDAGGFDEQLDVGASVYEETEFFLHARSRGHLVFFEPRARLTHLVASGGGTRQRDRAAYTNGIAHNRALVIRRYTPPRHWPRAAAAVTRMIWSRSRRGRAPRVLIAGVAGAVRGFMVGGKPRRTTVFADPVVVTATSPVRLEPADTDRD